MLVGYARVSTGEQNLDLQKDALKSHGCEKIFTDTISGTKFNRPGLEEALSYIREGDTLVVWKLDRLGRSLQDLIKIINDLQKRGIGFRSLQENMDTTTSGGKLIFHIFGALAEFERDIIRERTTAGLRAARARGRLGGRPKKMDARKIKMAQTMMQDPSLSIREICETLGVSKATLYRHIKNTSD
jgi:DNA invertase Pin-like site-specific DNA recombinase